MPQPATSPATSPRSGGGAPPIDYKGAAAKKLFERCVEAVRKDTARLDRDKQDWLNVLGYHGGPDNWWVTWDQTDNVWRRIPDDDSDYGLPAEVPRAASNMYRRKIDGIAAILNQSQPAQEWRPARDDDESRATAEIIEDVLPVLRDECDYDRARNLINLHVCLTDKVAYEVYFDNDEKYGTEPIGAVQCQACGWKGMPMEAEEAGGDTEDGAVCPECGGGVDQLGPLLDPTTGAPVEVHYPKGKLCGRIIPSFEISLPPNARECDERKVPYLLTHTAMPREDAARMWKDKAAYIRQAKSESSTANTSSQYATAVRNISSPHAAARGMMPQTADTVLVWRLVHDPIEDEEEQFNFPDGLDAVMIDGEIIAGDPLPLKDDQGQPLKPIVLRSYIQAPGSPFGIPPADDLGVLQRQRNLIETLLLLILLHDASPRTYIPLTVTLEDDITGMPGQQIRYRSNMPGDKPHTDPGINPPEGLYKALEMNDQAFDTISGLNAVLEGHRPEGNPTLGEVQTLRETGMATFKTPLDLLIDFEKRVSYLMLQWARQSMWTERLIRTVGDNGEWDIKAFSAADLHGSVDVYVNPISAWPKSALLQQLRLKDAVEMGVVNPQDPEIQEKVLSDYDLSHFKPSLDEDRAQIGRELKRWKEATGPQEIQPVGSYVNLPMHLFYKSRFMKTEEAEAIKIANPPVWQAMDQHIAMMKMSMQPPAAPPGAPGAGPAQPGAGKPGQPPPDGHALEHEIASGRLKPADGAPASPLDAMVEQGHLQPAPQAPQGKTGPSVRDLQNAHQVDAVASGKTGAAAAPPA